MTLISTSGKLVFSPENRTKKHLLQADWKSVVMIHMHDETWRYYSWFIKKRYHLPLNKPLRESHVTVVNDKDVNSDTFQKMKSKWDGRVITFEYDPDVRTNGIHWWLPVTCGTAEDMREDLGISRKPYFSFHLTVGIVNKEDSPQIEHSRYIHRLALRGPNFN